MEIEQNFENNPAHVNRVPRSVEIIFTCLVFRGDGFKFGQILGYLFSSQIPGTRDSEACSCWSDLHLGVQRNPSLVRLWNSDHIVFPPFPIIAVACVITAAFLNCNRFVAIRRHAYQVQALQVQPKVNKMSRWRLLGGWENLRSLKFTHISCFWFVTCQTFVAYSLAPWPQYQVPSNRVCHSTFWRWCFSARLSIPHLLLENDRHSTQCHERTAECIFMLQLRKKGFC